METEKWPKAADSRLLLKTFMKNWQNNFHKIAKSIIRRVNKKLTKYSLGIVVDKIEQAITKSTAKTIIDIIVANDQQNSVNNIEKIL